MIKKSDGSVINDDGPVVYETTLYSLAGCSDTKVSFFILQ